MKFPEKAIYFLKNQLFSKISDFQKILVIYQEEHIIFLSESCYSIQMQTCNSNLGQPLLLPGLNHPVQGDLNVRLCYEIFTFLNC